MATIKDCRTEDEKRATLGFVVCTDSFLSGWGGAQGGASFYALAVLTPNDAQILMRNASGRREMKRVRYVKTLPRKGFAHLKVVGPNVAGRWYEPGAF